MHGFALFRCRGKTTLSNEQKNKQFRMPDEVHQRPDGTASAAYLRNKEHFVEGGDMYLIEYSENNVLRYITSFQC